MIIDAKSMKLRENPQYYITKAWNYVEITSPHDQIPAITWKSKTIHYQIQAITSKSEAIHHQINEITWNLEQSVTNLSNYIEI